MNLNVTNYLSYTLYVRTNLCNNRPSNIFTVIFFFIFFTYIVWYSCKMRKQETRAQKKRNNFIYIYFLSIGKINVDVSRDRRHNAVAASHGCRSVCQQRRLYYGIHLLQESSEANEIANKYVASKEDINKEPCTFIRFCVIKIFRDLFPSQYSLPVLLLFDVIQNICRRVCSSFPVKELININT